MAPSSSLPQALVQAPSGDTLARVLHLNVVDNSPSMN